MSVWWGLVQLVLLFVAVLVTVVLWVPVFSAGAISGATLLVVAAWFAFIGSLYLCPEVTE